MAVCQLSKRLSSTLEVESGANDPMAIFMTIGCIQVLTGQTDFGLGLVQLLVTQMGVGALVG
jgi:potassium/hydrogen antiporter